MRFILWVSTLSNVGTIWALYGLEGAERVVMMACYAPLLLWGPLLAGVTVSYHRRHRAGGLIEDELADVTSAVRSPAARRVRSATAPPPGRRGRGAS